MLRIITVTLVTACALAESVIRDEHVSLGETIMPFKDMSHEAMLENRKTDHYEDFMNGALVSTAHAILGPIVKADEFTFAPW